VVINADLKMCYICPDRSNKRILAWHTTKRNLPIRFTVAKFNNLYTWA